MNRPFAFFACSLMLLLCARGSGAQVPAAPAQAAPASQAAQESAPVLAANPQWIAAPGGNASGAEDASGWRNTRDYPFFSLGDVVLRLEMVALAMQVRDYCANRRVPDDFVHDRLARLSTISGRTEDCRTLLEY